MGTAIVVGSVDVMIVVVVEVGSTEVLIVNALVVGSMEAVVDCCGSRFCRGGVDCCSGCGSCGSYGC